MAGKQIAIVNALNKLKPMGAILVFALLLGACRPMYGETSMGVQTVTELATIEINELPGRVGQKIRNELIFLLTGGDHPSQPKYKLEIVYRESLRGVLYRRTDDAAGKIYSLDVTYTLRDIIGKTELTKGRSHARAAFDKHKSTYSNIRAERDAKNRAAKDIANDINTRLAAYISSNR
ncbi:MAG: hypothetical protein GY927_23995 [bacterium]|nr:hypothetical protein [bacterium]